uniref:PHB domain-containing protein n=1 Tax=Bursaphelenchus xylophilus TaxID=6326 RepID=A0A1I7S1W8_BURXY
MELESRTEVYVEHEKLDYGTILDWIKLDQDAKVLTSSIPGIMPSDIILEAGRPDNLHQVGSAESLKRFTPQYGTVGFIILRLDRLITPIPTKAFLISRERSELCDKLRHRLAESVIELAQLPTRIAFEKAKADIVELTKKRQSAHIEVNLELAPRKSEGETIKEEDTQHETGEDVRGKVWDHQWRQRSGNRMNPL